MPRVRFELTIPVFELTKTFHALDRAAPVMGMKIFEDNKQYLSVKLRVPYTAFTENSVSTENVRKLFHEKFSISRI
jgi:hypothetical protein